MSKNDRDDHDSYLVSKKDVANIFFEWVTDRLVYAGIIGLALLCYFSH